MPRPTFDHAPEEELGERGQRHHVDLQHLELRLQVGLHEATVHREARVIDERIDLQRCGRDLFVDLIDRGWVRQILGQHQRLDPKLALQSGGELVQFVAAAGYQHAVVPVACKQQRQLVADAARGTSDQRGLTHADGSSTKLCSPARIGTGNQFSRGASGHAQRASYAHEGL